jgi:sporulation protein YlmC with PRC-barrel domain
VVEGARFPLVKAVLDKQMVDRTGRRCGKVDGLVMVVDAHGPPHITAIQVGGGTLAARVHPRVGRWMSTLARSLGVRDGRPYRIPWSRVMRVEREVTVDLHAATSALSAMETWVRRTLIERLPGGKRR